MPANFIEQRSDGKVMRHWFRCTHEFCKAEFSFPSKEIMWREVEGKAMPVFCRAHSNEAAHRFKQIDSPFFRLLPRDMQNSIYKNRKKATV